MAVHAIGDRGNRETLNTQARSRATPEKSKARWRWNAAYSAADIPQSGLDVFASMEGIHRTSMHRLARPDQSARKNAYVWQKLMKSGAIIANGTDAPVEDVDPIPSFYASVSRRVKDGSVFFRTSV
jgi:predicted amidohydrolase YtcJ